MAIRKFRKKMKPLIWVFSIAFFISMAAGVIANFTMLKKSKRYALELNGKKIDSQKVMKETNEVTSYLSQISQNKIDQEFAKVYAMDKFIEKELLLDVAKDLKLKVTSKEIDDRFKTETSMVKTKDQLKQMLKYRGYSTKTFKKYLEEKILSEKASEAIIKDVTISDEQVKAYFEENKYSEFFGKNYDEVKDTIKSNLEKRFGIRHLNSFIADKRLKANPKALEALYVKQMEKVVIDGEFPITNVDLISRAMISQMYGMKKDRAYEDAKKSFEKQIVLAKNALENGVLRDETLITTDQLSDLAEKLQKKLKSEIKLTDKDVKDFFEENHSSYDTQAKADAKVITFKVTPTKEDTAKTLSKAKEILATLTPENFALKAKEFSEGPTSVNGGDLGWFGKNQMVKQFETAAFKGEKGKVYPNVVKSQFGYHLIFVEDKKDDKVKARHILIKSKPSLETITKSLDEAKQVMSDLKENKMKYEDVKQRKIESTNIFKGEVVPSVANSETLNKAIFAANLNEYNLVQDNDIYIFNKIKQIKFEKATFEKFKEKAKDDLLTRKVYEKLGKIK